MIHEVLINIIKGTGILATLLTLGWLLLYGFIWLLGAFSFWILPRHEGEEMTYFRAGVQLVPIAIVIFVATFPLGYLSYQIGAAF